MFNPTAKLTMSIGILTKEAKGETEKHPVNASVQCNSKPYKFFCAFYILNNFRLFLQLNSFSSHIYFSV